MWKEVSKDDYNKLDNKDCKFLTVDEDGCKEYFRNDERHRIDGPAIRWNSGEIWYYLYGDDFKKEDFIKQLSKDQLKLFLLNPKNF